MSSKIDTEEKALVATVAQFTYSLENISRAINDLQSDRNFANRLKLYSYDDYARLYIKRHAKGVLSYIDQIMDYATFLLNKKENFSINNENIVELCLEIVDKVHSDPLKYQFTPLGLFLLTKVDDDVE